MFGTPRVMGGSGSSSRKTVPSTTPGRPAHIQEVMTMEEYNKVVAAEKDQVVVVRFYAPWCRVSSYIALRGQANGDAAHFHVDPAILL